MMEDYKNDSIYGSFAMVYDSFMDDIPYQEWADYLWSLLQEYHVKDGLVLDLGCGTGTITELLAKKGLDMIGVDYSEEMLQSAIEKKSASGLDILYLHQDMRAFELYGTVDAVVSICDSINYITEMEDLVEVFRLVNNYLNPGGVFIFDCNTVYKYENLLADNIIAEDRTDHSFIWENYYDKETMINEYALSVFIREDGDRYRKYQEMHYQRAYSLAQIKEALAQAGLEFIDAFEAFTKDEPSQVSERIYIVAKEQGKERIDES